MRGDGVDVGGSGEPFTQALGRPDVVPRDLHDFPLLDALLTSCIPVSCIACPSCPGCRVYRLSRPNSLTTLLRWLLKLTLLHNSRCPLRLWIWRRRVGAYALRICQARA